MSTPQRTEDTLFDFSRRRFLAANAPLADRMRPRTLEEFVGQERIVGPGRLLRRAIQADQLSSLIFYGPPGSGKTTLARIIANTTRADFITLNAVLSGVKEIRAAIDQAQNRLGTTQRRTILFIDEVHRFNKAQQDALLPHVESGTVIFIGATTENPFFEVNKALLSRSRIFELALLGEADLARVAAQALADPERGYGKLDILLADDALAHLVATANGDARALLNALELAVQTTAADASGRIRIDREVAEDSIQKKAVLYDKDGDAHYDVISAFIKSVRGSDPDAALYWLAKMVHAGEDPRFIFRRLLILASEDIGLADPHALSVVTSAARAYDYVGMPEGRFHLAHACLYLATAPKSNSLLAFFSALESVAKEREGEVPDHLKDGSRDGAELGHGQNYLYPHAYREHWVAQQYLPAALQGRTFYQPGCLGYEAGIKSRVERCREEQLAALLEGQTPADNPGNALYHAAHTSEPVRARNQWLKRTLEDSGRRLGELRDTLFRLADCGPDTVLLTVNDETGLLLWEGVRRIVNGGVFTLVRDARAAEILEAQARNLDSLERPTILTGDLATLAEHLAAAPGLAFDRVLARSLKSWLDVEPAALGRLAVALAPAGRLVVAEPLPRYGQRLYRLLPPGALTTEFAARLAAAEESIYADPNLDWCEEENLRRLYTDPAFTRLELHRDQHRRELYIRPADIDNWFTPRNEGERPAYCQHLAKQLDHGEVAQVKNAFLTHLAGRVHTGTAVNAYLALTR